MTQKRPRHTPEASGLAGLPLRGILLSRSVFSRLQGLSYATLSGSRRTIARHAVLSNGSVEPKKPPLAGADNCAVEFGPGNFIRDNGPTVDRHAALINDLAPVA